jgi:CRP/FNR family transcriptional regulator, cyclic AMP receptor protein
MALPGALSGLLSLGDVSVFAGLPQRDLARLDPQLPLVRWLYGTPMPAALVAEQHLFVVREGRLALIEPTASGHHPIMIALLKPGEVYSTLGEVAAPRLDALEDCAIAPIPALAVQGLIARYPRLGYNLAEVFSERVALLRETAAVLGEIRVEDRLRARLHQLADRFGIATPAGVGLPLELTHAQWALLVGAARESVTLAFGRLRAEGAIMVEERSVTIPWEVIRAREAGAGALGA